MLIDEKCSKIRYNLEKFRKIQKTPKKKIKFLPYTFLNLEAKMLQINIIVAYVE